MSLTVRLDILKDGAKSGVEVVEEDLWREDLGAIFRAATEPLSLKWRLSAVGGVIEFHGDIAGELAYACASCTEPLKLNVQVEVSHHWVPAGQLSADGEETLSGFDRDPDVSEHDGEEIDLSPVIRECLLVELPYAPSCDVSATGPCPEWSDEPRVIHPGGEAPEVKPNSPFAALASIKLSDAGDT